MLYNLIPKVAKNGLTMDRTNWKIGETNINILVIGIVYEGLAFQVLFQMIPKLAIQTLLKGLLFWKSILICLVLIQY